MIQLESHLKNEDCNYNRYSILEIVLIIDFMSIIRKVPFKTFENISDAFQIVWNMMVSASDARKRDYLH